MKTKKKLLFSVTAKDLIVETYRGSGAGGQNRNKVETCVRIKHPESGAVGQACEQREQGQNKRKAFERLVQSEAFQKWHKIRSAAALAGHKEVESFINKKVDEAMMPKNIKVEIKTEAGWIEWEDDNMQEQ